MASITIRNLDEAVEKRLRKQAAGNGRSLEAEARDILSRNTRDSATPKTGLDLIRGIREVVEKYGGVELEIPPREPERFVDIFREDVAEFQDAPPPKPRRKRKK